MLMRVKTADGASDIHEVRVVIGQRLRSAQPEVVCGVLRYLSRNRLTLLSHAIAPAGIVPSSSGNISWRLLGHPQERRNRKGRFALELDVY